jgi:hypothetical protein
MVVGRIPRHQPARLLDASQDLQIPIGSTGILVGAALRDDKSGSPEIQRDDLVMWALTDPQHPTRIIMDTSDFYVRQLLIRAAAAGERIAIYSYDPRRWYSVSQPNIAVVESGRPAEFVPTIIVNDRPHGAPAAGPGLSSTVITLGRSPSDTAPPDIRFQQISQSSVKITTASRSLDVAMVVFCQEQTWTGQSDCPGVLEVGDLEGRAVIYVSRASRARRRSQGGTARDYATSTPPRFDNRLRRATSQSGTCTCPETAG